MSSSRPQAGPFSVITDGDMSASITSKPTIIQKLSMIGYDIRWTGTSPIGDLTVQVSNTYSENADGSVRNSGTWTTLTLSATTSVASNSGNGYIDIDATGAYAIRLVYTRTSGTGTMNAVICGKVS
jgi:hypothetical protein